MFFFSCLGPYAHISALFFHGRKKTIQRESEWEWEPKISKNYQWKITQDLKEPSSQNKHIAECPFNMIENMFILIVEGEREGAN